MGRRHMITIPGIEHKGARIPLAIQMDDWIFSSAIPGRDPDTGQIPTAPRAQVELIFQNLSRLLERVHGSWDDVASIDFVARDREVRELINQTCDDRWPNLEDQPVRQTTIIGSEAFSGAMVAQGRIVAKLPS